MKNILLICRDFRYFAALIDHFEKDKYQFRVENYSFIGKLLQEDQVYDFVFLELDELYEDNIKMISFINDEYLSPLFVFSRDDHELEKKAYHDQGAEGYVEIPFSSLIVSARVKAIMSFMDRKRTSVAEPVAVISTPVIQTMVHKIRSEVQAILVGTQTALLDNPSLNVRYWSGKSPLRVVLDRTLRIPAHYHLLDDSLPTWVVTQQTRQSTAQTTYVHLDFEKEGIPALLNRMYENDIQSLLVEGGAQTLRSFIDSSLWDEAYIETGAQSFGEGVVAPVLSNACLQRDPMWVDHHLLTHYCKY